LNQRGTLIEAVRAGQLQSVQELLDHGADTEIADDDGLRPLHEAAYLGHRKIAAALVSAGADINARDRFGRTPLIHACASDHRSVVIYLLMNGADPKEGSDNWTPANLAAVMNHRELEFLLELASLADLAYVRVLAQSIASSPTNPSESADRIVVRRLLEEKGHHAQFEPLVTAFLQEIRSERPKPPKYVRPLSQGAQSRQDPPASRILNPLRAERFVGIPPESVGTGKTWIISGSDESVLEAEVGNFEDSAMAVFVKDEIRFQQATQGNFSGIINKAALELNRLVIDDSVSALDLFNKYFAKIGESSNISDFHRTLRAALMLYTDNRFFRFLNDCWRNGRSRELLGFSTLVSMAFRHAPYFIKGEVYRGVKLFDADHYQPGLVFRWPFFVSASKSRNVAIRFGDTLVTIEVPSFANVREISYCSLFPEEGEVLFRAYEIFEVLEASSSEIRIRVFYDEHFGTGWEIGENNRLRKIE
jgi:hypothetical protein